MGTYITHEGLPFHGALEKIRIRSCRVADLSLPGFDEKQRVKVAAAHEKIANQRNDFLQKQSTMLVREFAQIPWQEDIRRASRSVTQKGKP